MAGFEREKGDKPPGEQIPRFVTAYPLQRRI
jgi:hypothetical protein